MAEPAPTPAPADPVTGRLPLTLIDQAFVNFGFALAHWSMDREQRQFVTGMCRDLLPMVSRAHPQMGPVIAAFEALDGADPAARSFAVTALVRRLSDFAYWRGLQACAEAQRRGLLPQEGPWHPVPTPR